MRYWNQISGVITENSVWDELIANYDPAIAMDPEFMAFSHDHSRLYVNLQDNSALLVVNPENGEVLNIEGYGLKPMTATTGLGKGVDLLEEGGCSRLTSTGSFLINSCLFLGRTPDGIATVEVDGVNYVITAEEGSDFDLGEFEENYDAEDVLNGTSFAFPGFKADPSFFDPNNVNSGCSANFNKDCNEDTVAGGWCASGFELTIGSSAVNYETDFTQPEMSRIVGFGGRGIGISRVASTGAVTEIWDSVSNGFV